MSAAPISVLHHCASLGLGGTEKVMQSFVTHLPRHRYATAVYCPVDGPRARQVRRAGIPTYIGLDFLQVLLKLKPQIVHLHRAGWPDAGPLRDIRKAGVPVVVETNVFGRHDPSPEAAVIDRTLFVSHFCMDRYAQTTGVELGKSRYSVLYNPVDTETISANATPTFTAPVIGRISRPDPGKWSALALDFLPILLKDIPDFRYRIIGGIPEAEAFVREHGLHENVDFLPPIETDGELADFLSSISILAHANDTGESFGLVIAEAMAAGLPVITHPAEGLRDNAQLELVDHDQTGFIANNAAEYAQYTARLLRNPELAKTMGLAGQAKARGLYRAQDIAIKLANIYDELLTLKGIR